MEPDTHIVFQITGGMCTGPTERVQYLDMFERQLSSIDGLSGAMQLIMGKNGQTLPEIRLRPVGVVRRREGSPISELLIEQDIASTLDGIEDFSHLQVLYWAHRVPPEGRTWTKVHPRGREDMPLVGIFGTRSPARPNPICLTVVRLLERRGNMLRVEGIDALDGSPLVDIKPYVPSSHPAEEVSLPDWWYR